MFRNRLVQAKQQGTPMNVIGVSVDGSESHHAFINNLGLNFPLASDAEGKLCSALGTCPGFKPGQYFTNIVRTAFLIEGDGTISGIYNANGSPALISLIWDTAVASSPQGTPAATLAPTSAATQAATPAAARPAWHALKFADVRSGNLLSFADFAGKTVIVEAMATWCPNCLRQQQDAQAALKQLDPEKVVYLSLGVDPTEDAALLRDFANKQGFDWRFGISSRELTAALIEQFGRAVTNPPSTPLFIIAPDGRTSSLFTGGHNPDALLKLIRENS